MEGMIREGRPFRQIAQFLKRSLEHVTVEVQRNGGRYSYKHQKAHLNEDTTRIGGINNSNKSQVLQKYAPKLTGPTLAEAKISAIEESIQLINEQISILFDTIKELKK